jgi:hypothetical protein
MSRQRLYWTEDEQRAARSRENRRAYEKRRGIHSPYPRHEYDLYETPNEVIDAILAMVTMSPREILDVGAHDGRWGFRCLLRFPDAVADAVELRPVEARREFRRWYTGDFLEGARWLPQYDLIVGNPPYAIAEPVIRAALSLLPDGGELCMLLQSQFLHSKGRREGLFTEFPVRRIYPLAGRVSYHSGRGGTRDATAFLWTRGYEGREEIFRGRY